MEASVSLGDERARQRPKLVVERRFSFAELLLRPAFLLSWDSGL